MREKTASGDRERCVQFHRWADPQRPGHVLLALRIAVAQAERVDEDVRGRDAHIRLLVWCVDQLLDAGVLTIHDAADAMTAVARMAGARCATDRAQA